MGSQCRPPLEGPTAAAPRISQTAAPFQPRSPGSHRGWWCGSAPCSSLGQPAPRLPSLCLGWEVCLNHWVLAAQPGLLRAWGSCVLCKEERLGAPWCLEGLQDHWPRLCPHRVGGGCPQALFIPRLQLARAPTHTHTQLPEWVPLPWSPRSAGLCHPPSRAMPTTWVLSICVPGTTPGNAAMASAHISEALRPDRPPPPPVRTWPRRPASWPLFSPG